LTLTLGNGRNELLSRLVTALIRLSGVPHMINQDAPSTGPLAGSAEGALGLNESEGYFYYAMELADDQATGPIISSQEYIPKTLASEISSRGKRPYYDCLQLARPLKHGNTVMAGSFTADGHWVVTASADRTARVWSVETGEPLTPPLRHLIVVADARFLPGNHGVVTFDGTGGTAVWPLPVEKHTVPDVVALANLLSGGGVGDVERTLHQDPGELRRAWNRLALSRQEAAANK
jgi:hypothetical protein